jgi:hypothetical protein
LPGDVLEMIALFLVFQNIQPVPFEETRVFNRCHETPPQWAKTLKQKRHNLINQKSKNDSTLKTVRVYLVQMGVIYWF